MKAGYFIQKETPTQVLSCEYRKFFKNTYSEKQLETTASVHSTSKLEKWAMEKKVTIHKSLTMLREYLEAAYQRCSKRY